MENYVIRQIDELGRVVMPIGLRRELMIDTGDEVRIEKRENYIIISKEDLRDETGKNKA